MQEKMAEMMNLLNDYTKAKAPEKVLVWKEVETPITKFVNVISIVHEDDNEEENWPVNKDDHRVYLITADDETDEDDVVNESCSNKEKEIPLSNNHQESHLSPKP